MPFTVINGPSSALNQFPPPSTKTFSALKHIFFGDVDVNDGGPGEISGIVELKGSPNTPARRRVHLLDQTSLRIVRAVWSDAVTGAYLFERLKVRTYVILVRDHEQVFRPEAADNITPTVP